MYSRERSENRSLGDILKQSLWVIDPLYNIYDNKMVNKAIPKLQILSTNTYGQKYVQLHGHMCSTQKGEN